MIKVLHIIASPVIGGAERLLLELSNKIDRTRITIILGLFFDEAYGGSDMWNEASKTGLTVEPIRIKKWYGLMQIIDLIKIIRRHQPDIIHSHGYKTNILGLFLSLVFHIPIVTTFHGWLQENTQDKIIARFSLTLIRYFDRVIAVSQQIKNGLKELGVSTQRIEVIHNIPVASEPVDSQKIHAMRDELGIPEYVKLIGFIGRLEYVKGCHIFLETASIVLKRHPDVYFLVVGDGTEKENLIKQAARCTLGERIRFTGFRNDVSVMFSLFDLYVLSSLNEGIPLTILEAMSYGVPVVATSVGGVPEVIKDKVNGLLVAPNDPIALANGISESLSNFNESRIRAERAKSLIESEYQVNEWSQKISHIYEEIDNKKKIFSTSRIQ